MQVPLAEVTRFSANPAELRGHAEHCRYLADFTASPHDRQVLRHSAEDFDAEAQRAEDKHGAARKAKGER